MSIKHAILSLLAVAGFTAHAQFLKAGTVTDFGHQGDYFAGGARSRGAIYVIPNELNPEAAKPILEKAPKGAYLSVGAERGLLGALQTPGVTHLIQADLIPEVLLYNQINVILLKAARDLQDYLRLRQGPRGQWVTAAQSTRLNAKEIALLTDPAIHEIYRQIEPPARERLAQDEFFRGSSYLKDPALFMKAQKLARQNRIQVLPLNLTDQAALTGLAAELKELGLPLAVADLSNAWEPKYIGPEGLSSVLHALAPAVHDTTLVLATSVAHCFEPHKCLWNFHGATTAALRRFEAAHGGRAAAMTEFFSAKSRTSGGGLTTEKDLGPLGRLRLQLQDQARRCMDYLRGRK